MILEVITENLQEDDVIVYNGKRWTNYKKSYFLKDLYKEINILKAELENAKIELKKAQNTIMELASIMKGE